MKGLDYYMDGLLHAYLNQPEDEEDDEQEDETTNAGEDE